jgi:hypothetical protein
MASVLFVGALLIMSATWSGGAAAQESGPSDCDTSYLLDINGTSPSLSYPWTVSTPSSRSTTTRVAR